MPITVETGAGLPLADAYADIATVKLYCDSRGLVFDDTNTITAEQSIVRATAYIDGTYRSKFIGQRKNKRAQGLEWPRINAHDNAVFSELLPDDQIPVEIIRAVAEAASREQLAPGSLTPDVTPNKTQKSAQVDVIKVEYAISSNSVSGDLPVVSTIDHILAPLIKTGNGASVLFGETRRG